jgi:hypothetical protein
MRSSQKVHEARMPRIKFIRSGIVVTEAGVISTAGNRTLWIDLEGSTPYSKEPELVLNHSRETRTTAKKELHFASYGSPLCNKISLITCEWPLYRYRPQVGEASCRVRAGDESRVLYSRAAKKTNFCLAAPMQKFCLLQWDIVL